MTHPNAELMRRGYAAFAAGDLATLRELIAPNIVWHAPGRGPVSGTYKGIDELMELFATLGELTDSSLHIELHAALADDEHVSCLQIMRASRGERRLHSEGALVAHVHEGRLREVWVLHGDQDIVDAFFD